MIRHHVQKSAADAIRYYSYSDYLAEGTSLSSHLDGRAAERLGVAGSNAKEAFERLCHNLHPLTGEQLTERMRDDRIVGIDLTFDTPKWWAVLEALSPDRERLAELRRRASDETMRELEAAAAVRVRKGGRDENRTTGNLVWYRAEHDTTRPVDGVPDMQPHEHFFVLNATWDEQEQRWAAANLFDVIRDMPYYQAAHNQRLARAAQELGFDVQREGKSFTVDGMPKSVIDKFSRRKQLIEAEARKKCVTDADEKAQLGAKTREHKAGNLSAEQLRRLWAARLTGAEQAAVAELHWRAAARRTEAVLPDTGVTPDDALAHAAAHVFERKSSAPAREVLAHALTYGVGGFDVADAWAALEKAGRFTAEVEGRLYVASAEVLAEERSLVATAKAGNASLPPIDPAWKVRNPLLDDGQKKAVAHLLGSTSAVTMVVGAAGVGKSTLLKEARDGAAASGVRVLAFAPSAAASRLSLREGPDGFKEADTVAALMNSPKRQEQARGQVILVDEAALLGTKETAALLKLASRLNARVWLVGDDKQHKAVSRGSPFELLQKEAGIVPAVVEKVQRQKGAYRRLAELSRHKPGAALTRLNEVGWLVELPDGERYRRLADDYLAATAPVRRKVKGRWREVAPSALVVAPTHAEGAKVTAAIREGLHAQGRLGEEREFTRLIPMNLTEAERADPHRYEPGAVIQFTQNAKGHRRGERVELSGGVVPPAHLAARFQAYRPGTVRLAAGDRVRVTANGTTKDGHRLNNGELLTVVGFTKGGEIVDQRGWVIPKDYGHLAHGYVTTSVSSQSRTVDRVLVAMGSESLPATNREQLYVSLTRGKEWARVYTDDAERLTKAVEKTETRVSATELAERRVAQLRRRASLLRDVRLLARRAAADERPVDNAPSHAPERVVHHAR